MNKKKESPISPIDHTDSQTQTWLTTIRDSVAPRPHLKLEPKHSALLVVDMLKYFASPEGRCYLPASAAIVPQIKKLVSAWRTLGAPVIYTQHCHEGKHDLGMLGKFFSDYIRAGEQEAKIIPSLTPLDNESVFRKTTYDAFLNTGLKQFLNDLHIEQVVITGVLTHMCCETTARSAFCRGFEVYVPVDGTASTSEQQHLASLLGMADAVAVTMSTEEILKCCQIGK